MLLCHSGQLPPGLCLLPTCIKRDKKAALVLLPIAPHWKHPPMHLIFHSSVHYYCPPFLEHCMQLLGRTTGGTFECYCTRYEEAACIKAAMTPFWSGPPLNPPPTHPHLQLFAQLGASPLPIVLHASALLEQGHARMFYPFFSYRFFLLPYPDVLLLFHICLLY